ncbi:MAG: SsrA-binding protein [Candidatus Hepatoplasma vulgare]|nr:MAG: SsrA-binding protein [Candidatus Hepatoplasma sp.]
MKVISKNKRAKYDYVLKDTYLAGISLMGSEVKSIRAGDVSLNESYILVDKNRNLKLINMDVKKYSYSLDFSNYDSKRTRQLLLTKNEIKKISEKVKLENLVIIPTVIGLSHKGLVKLEIRLGKPRKKYDKREYEKEKEFKKIRKNYL